MNNKDFDRDVSTEMKSFNDIPVPDLWDRIVGLKPRKNVRGNKQRFALVASVGILCVASASFVLYSLDGETLTPAESSATSEIQASESNGEKTPPAINQNQCSTTDKKDARELADQIATMLEDPGTELQSKEFSELAKRADVITTGVFVSGAQTSDILGTIQLSTNGQILKGESKDLDSSTSLIEFYLDVEEEENPAAVDIEDESFHFVAFLEVGEDGESSIYNVIPSGLVVSCDLISESYQVNHLTTEAAISISEIVDQVAEVDDTAPKTEDETNPTVANSTVSTSQSTPSTDPEPLKIKGEVTLELTGLLCRENLMITFEGVTWRPRSIAGWPDDWSDASQIEGFLETTEPIETRSTALFTDKKGQQLEFITGVPPDPSCHAP